MANHVIRIIHVDGGWSVACRALGEPLMFSSVAEAARHARTMADRLCAIGCDVRVDRHDADNALLASQRFFSQTPQTACSSV